MKRSRLPRDSAHRYGTALEMDQPPHHPAGTFAGPCFLFPVRVYYEDTDLSGIVYHANYLKFCERARSELLTALGIDQRGASEAGEGHYAVADAHIRWRAPARLGDALVVETRPGAIGAASAELTQRVMRGAQCLADIAIRVGFIGTDGRPRRQPRAWREAFVRFSELSD